MLLLTPVQFDLSKTHSISNFDARFLKRPRDTHLLQCNLQAIHAFIAVHVGHADGAFHAPAAHDIDAILTSDREGILWLRAQDNTILRLYDLRGPFCFFLLYLLQPVGGLCYQLARTLVGGGRDGESRVAKAALISAVPPLMMKTATNPGGLPKEVFDGLQAQLAANRSQFYRNLPEGPFYGLNRLGVKASEAIIQNWWRQGMMGGAKAHYDGIVAFSQTDFTDDLKRKSRCRCW